MAQKPLRVLQILPALHVGGVERGTIEWAMELKRRGHEPIVVSAGGHGESVLSMHGVQHVTMAVGKKTLTAFLLINKLRCLFQELKVDLVHARSRLPAWLSYWAIKKMNKKPAFVTTLHGLHTVSPYAAVMAKGDQVIAVSQTAKNYLKHHFKTCLKSEPVVVYRGIDSSDFPYGFSPSQQWLEQKENAFPDILDCQKVLLPGRLSEIKGAMGLMPWLKTAGEKVVLMVNAEPEDSAFSRQFHTALVKADISNQVIWLGVERDMKQLYAWVDLVLSVNRKPESFGRTVLEALSIGCPVVAFDHGGVSEIMAKLFPEGLVPVNDWQNMRLKIEKYLQSSPTVQPHQSFTNQMQFDQTMDVYQRVLSQNFDAVKQ